MSGKRWRMSAGVLREARVWAIVFALAVVVWLGAESQTLSTGVVNVRVRFALPQSVVWRVAPASAGAWTNELRVQVRGSAQSLAELRRRLAEGGWVGLSPPVSEVFGPVVVDTGALARESEPFRSSGVTLLGAEPREVVLEVDRRATVEMRIVPEVPEGLLEGPPTVSPEWVTLSMPASLLARLPRGAGGEPSLTVSISPDELDRRFPAGQRASLTLQPRLPAGTADVWGVDIPRVEVAFVVANVRGETDLTVPVELILPPGALDSFVVRVDPADTTRTIRLSGPATLIDTYRSGLEVPVVGVRLSRAELERRVPLKPLVVLGLLPGVRAEVVGQGADVRLEIRPLWTPTTVGPVPSVGVVE